MENLKTSLILDMPVPSEVIEPVAPPPPPLPGYMKLLKTSEQGEYLKEIELGTIHLRRRHFLGGRGQKLAKFADG